MNLRWFSEAEFKRCKPSCSVSDCNEDALLRLDTLRDYCGFPIILNSAYRSPDYELSKGRKGTSSHCKGLAFDVRCNDSYQRALLVRFAIDVGFNRIGIGKNYIHLDCDSDKFNPCIWLY